MRYCGLTVALLALAASAAPTLSRAQDFYAGKVLSILVNFTPGGPTDTEARIVSKHISNT